MSWIYESTYNIIIYTWIEIPGREHNWNLYYVCFQCQNNNLYTVHRRKGILLFNFFEFFS